MSEHKCIRCNRIFLSKCGLNRHFRVHIKRDTPYVIRSNDKYKCDRCDNRSFTFKIDLDNHIYNYHRTIDMECDICTEVFLSKDALNAHMSSIHNIVKSHKCSLCDKQFICDESLTLHNTIIHSR